MGKPLPGAAGLKFAKKVAKHRAAEKQRAKTRAQQRRK